MAQLAEQGSLVPVTQSVVATVGEPDPVADQNVVVHVAFESRPKCLDCHRNRREERELRASSLLSESDEAADCPSCELFQRKVRFPQSFGLWKAPNPLPDLPLSQLAELVVVDISDYVPAR